jgi:hypothetical protein
MRKPENQGENMEKDKQQGSPFSEGRGRGFEIPEQKTYPATNEARTKAVEIDLGNLNQPGKGPVNFEPKRGTDLDIELREGGTDKDSDKDSQAY